MLFRSIGFDCGFIATAFVVSAREAAPCVGIIWSDPHDFAKGFTGFIVVIQPREIVSVRRAIRRRVGFASFIVVIMPLPGEIEFVVAADLDVKGPKARPCVGIIRSDPHNFAIGFDGLIVAVGNDIIVVRRVLLVTGEIGGSVPKARPCVGIIWLYTHEFAVRPDSFIVTTKTTISVPKVRPGVGIFGLSFLPPPAPFYHPLPVSRLIQRIGTLPPFGQAEMIGHTLSFLDDGVIHPER